METTGKVDIFLFLFFGTLALILLAGAVIVFFLIYHRRLLHRQAAWHAMEMKLKEELLYNNMEMLENERARIAKELHDDIGNIFSSLSWKQQQWQPGIPAAEQEQLMADSRQLIGMGITSVKSITNNIIPYGIDIFGLVPALEQLCDQMTAGRNITMHLHFENPTPALPHHIALHIYRIVQELLGNTLKYAQASEVEIILKDRPEHITLHYRDNGNGFKQEQAVQGKGFGLRNIESRIHMMQAGWRYTTAPGKGVQAAVIIPLNKQA